MKEVRKISKAERREMLERRDALFAGLANGLNTDLGTAIADKASVETRMLADESQYWAISGGVDKEDVAWGATGRDKNKDVTPPDNKTRSKTRIASARIGDMLFPTNAPNWGLRPTPFPDIPMELVMEEYRSKQAAQAPPAPPPQDMGGAQSPMEGQPPPPEQPPQEEPDYETLAHSIAARRCRKMSHHISDALTENDYPKLGRAVIMDGCKLGTGIVKGPYVRYEVRHSYESAADDQGEVAVLKVRRVPVPGVARVSPWMFFPQRARSIEEAEHAFELHVLNRTQLIQMVDSFGFYRDQVAKLLRSTPSMGKVDGVLARRAQITNYSMTRYENSYAVWEYQGLLDTKFLEEMGFPVDSSKDVLSAHYGAVWFSEDCILRVDMSPIEADTRLPYHVWNYEEDETHIFGFGVPFVLRDDQFVINMVWTSMLHNASVSAGPQMAIEKGVLMPADGSFHINGPKLWYKNDIDVPMNQAMEAFVIPSTLQSTMPLYQQAVQNAEVNSNLPLLLGDPAAAGEQQGPSGLVNVTSMNQANVVQRQAAHAWDDNITDPLITKLYHWFMQSDEHDDIKGDFHVEVRGASHLLVKDTQAQHCQLLLQMAGSDPNLASILNLEEVYRVYLSFLDITVDTIVKTPEQIAADQANQQPDPMEQAELDKMASEAELNRARAQEITASSQQGPEGQGPEPLNEKDVMELQLKYAELEDRERDRQAQLQIELIRRETQMLKVASDEKISFNKVLADMEKTTQKSQLDAMLKQRKQESEDYFDAARLELEKYREKLKAINVARGFDTYG